MYRIIFTLALFATSALAAPKPLEGWVVRDTGHAYAALIDRVKAAAKSNGLAVVTPNDPALDRAGGWAERNVEWPGPRSSPARFALEDPVAELREFTQFYAPENLPPLVKSVVNGFSCQ